MAIQLSPKTEAFIAELVGAGDYPNAETWWNTPTTCVTKSASLQGDDSQLVSAQSRMSDRNLLLKVTSEAREDLEQIFLYGLELWDIDQAERYEQAIHEVFAHIQRHPEIGKGLGASVQGLGRFERVITWCITGSVMTWWRCCAFCMSASMYRT